MELPQIVPLPEEHIRPQIPHDDWTAYVEATQTLARAYLTLADQSFAKLSEMPNHLVPFLSSYLGTMGKDSKDTNYAVMSNAHALRTDVFLLVHRLIMAVPKTPEAIFDWQFLGNLARVYRNDSQMKVLVQTVWQTSGPRIEPSLGKYKSQLGARLLNGPYTEPEEQLAFQLLPLMAACPLAGVTFVTGSDFLDETVASYAALPSSLRPKLLLLVYLSLESLLRVEPARESLLVDLLYGLKADTESDLKVNPGKVTLLADLVSDTPILRKLDEFGNGATSTRTRNLIASLQSFRHAPSRRPKRHKEHRADKGKERVTDEYGDQSFGGVHVHRLSRISQIQDLFPDVGTAFAAKLLDEYNEDVEQVTAHLLEDSLPSHLRDADRTENIVSSPTTAAAASAAGLAPRPTPPPSPPAQARRNVFDNDAFDRLAVDTSRIHLGRKDQSATADTLLSNQTTNKAAILSALAAFDADDDERDDTYDFADVGGSVDTPRGDEDLVGAGDKIEEALFGAYTLHPEVFERDPATRRGQARASLRSETGLTDEAIEGWAVMLKRDPRRLRRLETKHGAFAGQQRALASTAWSGTTSAAASGTSGTEDSEASGPEGGRGRYRGRGGGRGRGSGGRGGGDVAGPTAEKGTQVSRQRKEAGKGSRANHNRRDQRAKKMTRAGFPG